MKTILNDSVKYSPSPWPLITSVLIFPVIIPLIAVIFVSPIQAFMTFIVCLVIFCMSFSPSDPIFLMRVVNAVGDLNYVKLSPQGIVHEGIHFWKPYSFKYSWNDIHSLRLDYQNHTLSMIVFTPVEPTVGKFYRSHVDGSYGVPDFGNGNEMLETMIAFHRKFSTTGLPTTD